MRRLNRELKKGREAVNTLSNRKTIRSATFKTVTSRNDKANMVQIGMPFILERNESSGVRAENESEF